MKVVVVGAGVAGTSVAEQLSQEGHRVVLIDETRERINRVKDAFDVLTVCGNGALPSTLERAGIRDAQMVIAATNRDAVNLVVGMLAARYHVEHRIVRIRNQEYTAPNSVLNLSELGVGHVVNPEPFIVDALVRMIGFPGAYDFAHLAGGQVLMFGFHAAGNSPAVGLTLARLREMGNAHDFLVLYITRHGQVFVPRGDDVVEAGDGIHFLVSPDSVDFLLSTMHPDPEATRRMVIFGGTRIGMEVMRQVQETMNHVVLIEPDPVRASEVAAALPDALVLSGEATDVGILEEASIDRCDLFCALTYQDETNMLAALMAKRQGAAHTALLVRQPEYVSVLDSLGIDIVINPRLAVAGEIMQHVRRGHVFSVTRPAEGRGEIIEMEAIDDCRAVREPLRKLNFPRNALVGAIVRNGHMEIPTGDTVIQPHDRVLVYAMPDAISKIEKLFSGH